MRPTEFPRLKNSFLHVPLSRDVSLLLSQLILVVLDGLGISPNGSPPEFAGVIALDDLLPLVVELDFTAGCLQWAMHTDVLHVEQEGLVTVGIEGGET